MIDRKQIAAILGIDPNTFRRSVETRPDFPRPCLRLSRKTVRWEEAKVREWLRVQGQRA